MNLLSFQLQRPKIYYFWEVAGEPVAQERVGFNRGRSFVPTKTRNGRKNVADSLKACYPRISVNDSALFCVRLRFFSNARSGDVDNKIKLALDSLKGIMWRDDSQVREVYAIETPNHRPRTEILVYPVTEDYFASKGELE